MPAPTATDLLPPAVAEDMAAFLAAGKTGQIILDVVGGMVNAYHLNQYRRVKQVGTKGG